MHIVGEDELQAVKRVLDKQKLFRYQLNEDSECDLFEKEFCDSFGAAYSLLVTSGTNALIAAMAACGIGPGDEVIIPAYTFVATATAVVNVGAIPVVVNIDETYGMDPSEVERCITERTKAIIPVHMDGLAAHMEIITQIASNNNLIVIEDTAQAIGGSFQGKKLGCWGDVGCFSLNRDKNITCGEGGIVLTNCRKLYERIFCLHDASGQFNPTNKDFFQEITPFMGMSMRVSDLSGAIMRVQLKRLDGILKELRMRKELYCQQLLGIDGVRVVRGNDPDGECCTSLHLLFDNPDRAQEAGNRLRSLEILVAPPTTRPAHAVWKWSGLLGDHSSYHRQRNPYEQSDRKYNYKIFNFLPSVEILARTLKMDLDVQKSLEEVKSEAQKIAKVVRGDM